MSASIDSAQHIIAQIEQATTEEDYLVVLQKLHQLDLKDNHSWFLPYYACLTCILLSMLDLHIDKKDEYIEDAESFLRRLHLINPRDAETHVVHAFWLQAKIMVSVLLRGPMYIGEIEGLLEKAQALDPDNPRVYFLKAQAALNKPSFIGGGKKKAKPLLMKAQAKYEAYELPYDLAPNWGKAQTFALIEKIS